MKYGDVMVKINNIMLITIVGLAIIFSGCTGGQEKNTAGTAQPTPGQTNPVQTTMAQPTATRIAEGPYDVQLTEVRILQDCIVASETNPCILSNLQVKNNNVKTLDVKLLKYDIIGTSGKLLATPYDREVGLSNLCVRQAGLEFKLNENTINNAGFCFPIVHKADNPTLNIEAMINGERKTYAYDLTKYDIPN